MKPSIQLLLDTRLQYGANSSGAGQAVTVDRRNLNSCFPGLESCQFARRGGEKRVRPEHFLGLFDGPITFLIPQSSLNDPAGWTLLFLQMSSEDKLSNQQAVTQLVNVGARFYSMTLAGTLALDLAWSGQFSDMYNS